MQHIYFSTDLSKERKYSYLVQTINKKSSHKGSKRRKVFSLAFSNEQGAG
jgi:hypothetical protein